MASFDISATIATTEEYVINYMSSFDASHDVAHVHRVRRMALLIARTEAGRRSAKYDLGLIELAALLHDVGDTKYCSAGEDKAKEFLLSVGLPLEFAARVQEVVNAVSYSKEVVDPASVTEVMRKYPELGPVQDADRLDALGAVGIARCFTYQATHGAKDLGAAVSHFQQKLVKLELLMKTTYGRELARKRTERVKQYIDWWSEEVEASLS